MSESRKTEAVMSRVAGSEVEGQQFGTAIQMRVGLSTGIEEKFAFVGVFLG